MPTADVAPIADTVREMQERLTLEFDRFHKSNFMTPEVRQWIIDQIAKEVLEGKDDWIYCSPVWRGVVNSKSEGE